MSTRISPGRILSDQRTHLIELYESVQKAAADAGLDPLLLELLKSRVSQINGCAFCLDMHAREARELGETERRIYLLPAWREAPDYTEQERAALALAEAMTRIGQTQDVPDDVYEEATRAFTEQQYAALVWAVTIMNSFNRLNVTARTPVPEPAR
ncbi:carboxymuconolactone decarboxylase family protein [Amycolatopsis sp. K13G38]|uniref:Carboxymuconolactone decarboxylase family protein n=1 Tax=Amycolatopsis acididurans TaxID=2724524 RepID=A0ABX1JE95_9PSEU|nr:carboxymuconolactone decarboxylase family protein [Amycolatopsis acididurans]NKQ57551.1 carboxymuconolactone decarboxylase family protein [Amycolatopsis acididurans]